MRTRILILFLLSLAFINCTAQTNMSQLNWMCGDWNFTTKNTKVHEHWEKKSDSLFSGFSFSIQGIDTVSSEHIEMLMVNKQVQYRVTVKEQNKGETIPFLMMSCNADSVVFENRLHDFPQRIIYKKVDATKMIAAIEGPIKNTWKRREFIYLKEPK